MAKGKDKAFAGKETMGEEKKELKLLKKAEKKTAKKVAKKPTKKGKK